MSHALERKSWPGWDGVVLLLLCALVVGTWAWRGRAGPDLHVVLLLVIDGVYLAATWWSRR